MNKPEYKNGDEVLVRAKLDSFNSKFNTYRICDVACGSIYICEESIYSHAPEFSPGEEIEVSDNEIGWSRAIFLNFLEMALYPYRVSDNGSVGHVKYARKIQQSPEQKMLTDGVTIDGKKYKLVEV